MKKKIKNKKRVISEKMSTTFMYLIASRLISAIHKEVDKMKKEIEDCRPKE